MHESEALTKFCPYATNLGRRWWHHFFHRAEPKHKHCIGSACMAWQQFVYNDTEKRGALIAYDPPEGQCGMTVKGPFAMGDDQRR